MLRLKKASRWQQPEHILVELRPLTGPSATTQVTPDRLFISKQKVSELVLNDRGADALESVNLERVGQSAMKESW